MYGSTFGAIAARYVVDCRAVELLETEAAAQRVVMREQPLDLGRQRRQVGQIHEADGAAADFVFVGRPDAALGGADAGRRIVGLAHRLQLAVQRQDQGRVLRDAQTVRGHRDALLLELGDFIDQSLRIDHHAVADDGELAAAHHAGGQQRQLVGDAVDHQSVAGIMATLEADDDIGLLGQPVDDLALAFVAPLGPDYHHIRH